MGRYVFTPEIFDALDRTKPGVGGEIQLTDAIAILLAEQPVYGFVFDEGRYDIGKKLDYLRATVELALDRDDLGPEFAASSPTSSAAGARVGGGPAWPGSAIPLDEALRPTCSTARRRCRRRPAGAHRRRWAACWPRRRGDRAGAAVRQHRDGRLRRAGGRRGRRAGDAAGGGRGGGRPPGRRARSGPARRCGSSPGRRCPTAPTPW